MPPPGKKVKDSTVPVEPSPCRSACSPAEREVIETELLLEAIFRYYGFDFREYAAPWLSRRIQASLENERLHTISELQDKVLHNTDVMERLLLTFSINVTSMFRDPGFYRQFRTKVIPHLHTYPFVRIWHAGCATGEEAYSMAILLKEAGLLERSTIFATDMNELVLRKAKSGIFPLRFMKEYTTNYLQAGGTESFSRYYTAKYDHVLFDPSLKKHIVFAPHNLATDFSFN